MLPFNKDKAGNVSVIISRMMKDKEGQSTGEYKESEKGDTDFDIAMEKATEGFIKCVQAQDTEGCMEAFKDMFEMAWMEKSSESPRGEEEKYYE